MASTITAIVITVSDRCAVGRRTDESGPLAARLLRAAGVDVVAVEIVPDDVGLIRRCITGASDRVDLVFTTGGTGVGPRDVTPEATAPLLTCEIPGVADAIRRAGLPGVPGAMLGRGLVGLTSREPDASLVVNAPGSVGGVKDAIATLVPVLGHILEQRRGGDH